MASEELQNLVKAMVKQAYDENIKVTELNELIVKYRKEIGLCKQKTKVKPKYREATEEETKFKEEVYKFFCKEISLEEATSKIIRRSGDVLSESAYQRHLLMFSEIICAAKMLANDGNKITNYNIRDILWNSEQYTNYNNLLLSVGNRVQNMKEIAFSKWINGTWEYYNAVGPTAVTINSYFELLEKNGIQ